MGCCARRSTTISCPTNAPGCTAGWPRSSRRGSTPTRDPGVAALSRLAFHWDAAHDLARTLAASVRAGLVAKRLGAAEVLTQLDRALSLWDRVPDAEAVAGHPRAEMLILLGESANEQGEEERGYTLVRTALDMLGSDPDRLLASRAYAALGVADVPAAMAGRQEAIRRAVEYAGDSPSEELALALIAQSWFLFMHHRFADSVEAAARAVDAARGAGCVEAELDALLVGSNSRYYLGHVGDVLAGQEQVLSVARAAGTVAHAVYATGSLAMRYRIAGQVGRGLALASEGFKEGLAQGLPVQAAQCGLAALQGLVWRGRFEEAEQLLEELGELGEPGLPEARAELLLARGDADAASPLIRAFAASRPADFRVRAPGMSGLSSSRRALRRPTRSAAGDREGRPWPRWTTPTPRCGRPRSHESASRPSAWAARRPMLGQKSCETFQRGKAGLGTRRTHRRMAPDLPRGPACPRRGLRRQLRREDCCAAAPGGSCPGTALWRLLRPRAPPGPGARTSGPRRPGRGPRAPRRVLERRPRHGCPRPRAPSGSASPPAPGSRCRSRHHARDR